jgi:hypothetical protein
MVATEPSYLIFAAFLFVVSPMALSLQSVDYLKQLLMLNDEMGHIATFAF